MLKNLVVIGFALMVVGLIPASCLYPHLTKDTAEFVVEGHERVVSGSGNNVSSKYVVFTDSETFSNSDSIWRLKFNSSDVRREMKIGSHCEAEVYGWRIPVFSMYRNIVSVECDNS